MVAPAIEQPTVIEEQPSGSPSPESPPAPAQEAPVEAADPLAGIDAHDPADLFKRHPGLQRYADSKAGEITSKNTPKLREELAAQIRQELEDERLAQLAESDDLVGLGEAAKARIQRDRAAKTQADETARAEQARTSLRSEAEVATATEIGEAIWETVKESLDAESQKALVKDWGPGPAGVKAFTTEAVKSAIAAGIAKGIAERLPKLKEELEAALSKDGNAQALAEEPSPDTRGGRNVPASDRERDRALAEGAPITDVHAEARRLGITL